MQIHRAAHGHGDSSPHQNGVALSRLRSSRRHFGFFSLTLEAVPSGLPDLGALPPCPLPFSRLFHSWLPFACCFLDPYHRGRAAPGRTHLLAAGAHSRLCRPLYGGDSSARPPGCSCLASQTCPVSSCTPGGTDGFADAPLFLDHSGSGRGGPASPQNTPGRSTPKPFSQG